MPKTCNTFDFLAGSVDSILPNFLDRWKLKYREAFVIWIITSSGSTYLFKVNYIYFKCVLKHVQNAMRSGANVSMIQYNPVVNGNSHYFLNFPLLPLILPTNLNLTAAEQTATPAYPVSLFPESNSLSPKRPL